MNSKKKPLHTTVVKVFATSKRGTQPPNVQLGEIRLDHYGDAEVATLVSGTPRTMRRVLDAAMEATGQTKAVRKPFRSGTGRLGEYLVALLSGTLFGALWARADHRHHDEPLPEDHGSGDSCDDHAFEYHDVGHDYFDGSGGGL